jgi:methionine-rich copper-binding protein CopC
VGSVLVAPAISVAAVVLLASPALADASLERSTPTDGARLPMMPETATLTFNQPVLAQGASASLEDVDGKVKTLPDVIAQGRSAVFALPVTASPGAQILRWRVVSTDGHPITGTVGFTVTSTAPQSTTRGTQTPSSTPVPDQASLAGDDSQVPGVLIGGAIGAVLGTVWVIVGGVRRRRRKP